MRSLPALFTQQAECSTNVRTKSLSEMNPTQENNTTMTANDNTNKEQQVNEVVNEVLQTAAPFIPGGAIAAKVASVTGLAPEVVHLGFLFAHLFSHPKVAQVVAAAAPAPVAIDPAIAAAAAAKAKQIADLKAQLASLESA